MADLQLLDCFQPELVRLERVRFFQRQLLSVADMVTEQDYVRQKLRRHNRFLHGWGVVCGLEVIPQPTADAPWRVEITAGYALGPYGDEVYVGESVFLDLAQCGPDALTSPCEPDVLEGPSEVSGGTLYVAIKYAECVTQPVRAMPAGCACEDIACEYSRIRDSFELSCLTELPPSPAPPLLCDLIAESAVPPCPPCPEEPWVVLASVTLPAPGVDVAEADVDNLSVRRQLFSTAILQHQLIDCCCGGRQEQVLADLVVTTVLEENLPGTGPGGLRLFRYRIDVWNNGPAAASNITITDTINIIAGGASQVTFTNFPQGQWTQPSQALSPQDAQHVFQAQIPSLPVTPSNQAPVSLWFEILLRSNGVAINVTNGVGIASATPDPNSSNNHHTVTTVWNVVA